MLDRKETLSSSRYDNSIFASLVGYRSVVDELYLLSRALKEPLDRLLPVSFQFQNLCIVYVFSNVHIKQPKKP
jgi:hypothetical protein